MPAERSYPDLSRPIREFSFVVDATEAGGRLDRALQAHFPWKSRTHYQRLLNQGDILVDGQTSKASARLREGQRVVLRLPDDPSAPERESADDLVFLFEDEHLAAVDKPSGMTVHPVGRIRHGTLINKLHARYRREHPDEDVVPRLGHRLDKDTSGIVLFVKSRHVDQEITDAFTERRVRKTYLALVRGIPRPASGIVDAPIGPDPRGSTHLHMMVRSDGQPARSRWALERRFRRHALVRLSPLTGRTHQLRVHMAHLGHPILCDHLYGDLRPLYADDAGARRREGGEEIVLDRLALHAQRLELAHPVTGEDLSIVSPLPEDLRRAVDVLRALAEDEPS